MRLQTGVYGHRKRVCAESRLGIPCHTGKSNQRQRCAGPMLYQLSYAPASLYHMVKIHSDDNNGKFIHMKEIQKKRWTQKRILMYGITLM